MKWGYARVSTVDQNLDKQRLALSAAGCDKVFKDHISGTVTKRSGLDEALAQCGDGDVLMVWKLDRLGLSLPHLIEVIRELSKRRCGFRSLFANIDTMRAGGHLVFHLIGALVDFERALIAKRSKAGLAAERSRGVRIGRKRAMSAGQVRHARASLEPGERPSDIAQTTQVGRSTSYRALDAEKGKAA
nr:recombinase family protein [Novosphingopyxis iocasae]